MTTVVLPDGPYRLGEPGAWQRPATPITSRVAYAAAHVVPRVTADNTPGQPADLDWDSTLAFRHHLWSWGLGVAEAMDTAQRGMGLDWPTTQELIKRSAAEAQRVGGRIACGAGTDQLELADLPSGPAALDLVYGAYAEQFALVHGAGTTAIMMASRALARTATSVADYRAVYDRILDEVDRPVILHWLGDMFDPALTGYWGSSDVEVATDAFVELIIDHPGKVDGVKVSLLDADHERALRGRLPAGVRLYTGDDFNYPELVVGDATGHSDALLGIFAGIAPAAATALQRLAVPDAQDEALAILESTRELGRHIFCAPTFYYKTGIAFLAWLNGHQPGFQLINGLHAGRSVPHLIKVFALADRAGLLDDPELAAHRLDAFLTAAGVDR